MNKIKLKEFIMLIVLAIIFLISGIFIKLINDYEIGIILGFFIGCSVISFVVLLDKVLEKKEGLKNERK